MNELVKVTLVTAIVSGLLSVCGLMMFFLEDVVNMVLLNVWGLAWMWANAALFFIHYCNLKRHGRILPHGKSLRQ